MSDAEIRLSFENKEFTGNRHNMTLFTFLGSMSSRNHVFVQTQPTDLETKIAIGSYIFRREPEDGGIPVYDQLVQFIRENDFPMHLNENSVPECDEVAFQRFIDQNVAVEFPDFFPEDWS